MQSKKTPISTVTALQKQMRDWLGRRTDLRRSVVDQVFREQNEEADTWAGTSARSRDEEWVDIANVVWNVRVLGFEVPTWRLRDFHANCGVGRSSQKMWSSAWQKFRRRWNWGAICARGKFESMREQTYEVEFRNERSDKESQKSDILVVAPDALQTSWQLSSCTHRCTNTDVDAFWFRQHLCFPTHRRLGQSVRKALGKCVCDQSARCPRCAASAVSVRGRRH